MDKIVCFGKNYSEHMTELGDAPVSKPVIFLKPASVLRQCKNWGETLPVSLTGEETHYECELVLKLGNGGYRLDADAAKAAIKAFSIGLDMTLRQKQAELKKAGHPWTTAKVFPDAAIIGPWVNMTNDDFLDSEFSFNLDGSVCQKGRGRQMLFNPVELVQYASAQFPLCAGDVLFTGTPAGVGAVRPGSLGVLRIADYSYQVQW